MISLDTLFWFFIILFGMIGMMRGWAKELLVAFSVVLSIFITTLLESFIPFVRDTLVYEGGANLFWFRTVVLAVIVFAGYQSPNIPRLAQSGRFARERFQDMLLGLFIGAVNGYLIFGTVWFFLDAAGYPFPDIISAPLAGTAAGDAAARILPLLAPNWLGTPTIYFAAAIALAFVLIVFL